MKPNENYQETLSEYQVGNNGQLCSTTVCTNRPLGDEPEVSRHYPRATFESINEYREIRRVAPACKGVGRGALRDRQAPGREPHRNKGGIYDGIPRIPGEDVHVP